MHSRKRKNQKKLKLESFRILLIAPVHPKIRSGQFLAPPLGLYRIKAFIERKLSHVVIDILDVNLYQGNIPDKYFIQRYDIIGSSLLEGTIESTIRVQEELKRRNCKSLNICGGHAVTGRNVELILKRYPINYAILGLGEFPLLNLLLRFGSNKIMRRIPGIAFLTLDQNIIVNASHIITTTDFNELCKIDYSVIPYETYWNFNSNLYDSIDLMIMKNANSLKTVRINTSTHCRSGCTFCSATNFFSNCITQQPIITQDPNLTIETLSNIIASHPETEAIFFNDDNFTIDRLRVNMLSKLIQTDENLRKLNYICLSRLDYINDEMLQSLKLMNVAMIIYGMESFDKELIRIIHKSYSEDYVVKCKNNILSTLKFGIIPLINIILFLPNSNINTIVKTIEETLVLIRQGARVGINLMVEDFEGSALAAQREALEILCIDRHKYFLPKDEQCNFIMKKFFSSYVTLHQKFELELGYEIKNNSLLRCIEIFYCIYAILSFETKKFITISKYIINDL